METGATPQGLAKAQGQREKNVLIVINDSAHGSERAFNALRLAASPANETAQTFACCCWEMACHAPRRARSSPTATTTPAECSPASLTMAARSAAAARAWTRGIRDKMLIDAATRSTPAELTDRTLDADTVLVT